MDRYIVRVSDRRVASSITLHRRQMTRTARADQIREVAALRKRDGFFTELGRWLGAHDGAQCLSTNEQFSPTTLGRLTGVEVLSLSEKQAAQFRADFPTVSVLLDRSMSLITPRRALATSARLTNADRWHLRAVKVNQANGRRAARPTGKRVRIAVLDTGVDDTHPELAGRVSSHMEFDANTWAARPMSSPGDTDGHGTHVAGLICGKTVGIAPGAQIASGVMIPKGNGHISDFILALEWAAGQPEIQIVNVSAGLLGYYPEMAEVVDNLIAVGVLPVIAVGNEGRDRTRSPGNYVQVLSVGACNATGAVADFSGSGTIVADNHQYQVPDLIAPGAGVYSSVKGGTYEKWDGTSMAAPIVSGLAALKLEENPDLTVSELTEALLSNCKKLKAEDARQGRGLIQWKRGV